jgi:ATP-dependent DNA helicase UvrD/PcrA
MLTHRMSENPHAEHLQELLSGLNQPQRKAVTHGEGPLLILAGAGSGKTRVLTHRIAYLIFTDQAQPGEILAITFTNKAAQEMRERVELLLGRRTRGMWLLTFHAACARMLRAEVGRLGYTRQFTIYDQADARRLTKRCIDELGIDPKRFTPAAIHTQISDAKNKLRDAAGYRQLVGSYFEQTVADVYELYERDLHRMNAMDFDDLLFRAVNLLELFPEVRERYASAFRHVLVDEYQDTNHAQYRWLQLLVGGGRQEPVRGQRVALPGHRNLAVVGDDDQCLARGTLVTMGDGSLRPIERVRVGDLVRSCHGSGEFRPARVSATSTAARARGIAINLRSGRRIVSTPEHVHFAGYRQASPAQLQPPYPTGTRAVGSRVRTTRSAHAAAPASGVHVCAGVLRARRDGSFKGLHHGAMDRHVHASAAPPGARPALGAAGPDLDQPDHFAGEGHSVTVTLCGDRHGATPMHTVVIGGRDRRVRAVLEEAGLKVRAGPAGSASWAFETAVKSYRAANELIDRIAAATPVAVRRRARMGASQGGDRAADSLPFVAASGVRRGMAMFVADGGYDIVDSVEEVELDVPVYDINVEHTHNFIAEGIVTHNSIYGFRGADIHNILDFEDDFPDARVVKLEQNYRSTQNILSAANAVISHNRGRKSKSLWSELGEGDAIKVREVEDEHAEARFVVGELERLVDEGVSRAEIAVFYRTNAMSRVIEDTLVRREIAYQVIGGTKFYERAEIKDAIAYLTLLANPHDVVSFTRVANSPRRGIGQTSLSRVIAHAATMDIAVWDAALEPSTVPGLGTAAVKAFERFMDTMASLRERAQQGVPVGDLLEAMLSQTGYVETLEAERTIEAQGRIENLEELVQVAREFDATADSGEDTLDVFLQQLALVADSDSRSDEQGLVTLMTLHNAKGLEYPIVFIVGCEDGVFPHSRAIEEGGLEEERRLFYVGVTRAMRDLYLTYARRRAVFGSQTYGLRSRFLDEIPADLTDREDEPVLRAGARGSGGGWGGAAAPGPTPSWASTRTDAPAVSFRLGEDVQHAAFGDGVVIGVEPGGVIVVRFARDGTERKLMADFAPVTRR